MVGRRVEWRHRRWRGPWMLHSIASNGMELRTLITNNTLAERSGTALYVRDLASGLRARGIVPAVYTFQRGEIGEELERAGVEVVDDLRRLSAKPDVIHGHHEIPAMSAFLHFPGVPGIFVCHDRHHHSDI